MPAVAQAPAFSTRTPDVVNSVNVLSVSLPLLNAGTAAALDVSISDITLASATRTNPVLPLLLGILGADNSISVNATFSAASLTPGAKYLLTVRGTYHFGSASYGFSVNRFITVPAPVAPPMKFLAARLVATVN